MSNIKKHNWFLLTSKPREEQRAFDNLSNQGYEVFLPKIAKVTNRQGVKSVSLQPLFPNYLFINLDLSEANFNAIRSTRGVGSFVRFGLNYATLNENLIKEIKQNIEGSDHKSLDDLLTYQQGEKVQVTQGPFKGLEAIYKTKDGLERCIILIKMLGQESEVAIENQAIEKLD
ncbi:transcription/translation regulatory transformer protein RfaH [Colwellia hornerae]|uniref:Transcription/translation regulatory transformer protein RfaH n=1 Tax=Colwellia hornerae TaxID=89402 RepID=A0A5C6QKQ3_9GAMM|nr:transcription/translation regulatory transformer protein RfaH [Colwellia hornerae]TWX54067.1 transcription/translation regulatory transformer protein RfaH [Colwellia hornerae]TWX60842.1 transcription/translation regulatory transformer protein RfaH [Colwellia hornerae]TWX69172.1 transcription/translation regulatory transformer protein RfaH [Colwellia hornerae]